MALADYWDATEEDATNALGASSNQPRGVRNNNPGNIRLTADSWAGEVPGRDSAFKAFDSPESGFRAMGQNLLSYQDKHGLNTVSGIIGRWAPSSENNTGAYVNTVSSRLGVSPNAPLDLRNPETMSKLMIAMADVENGPGKFNQGQAMAGASLALGSGYPSSTREMTLQEAWDAGKSLSNGKSYLLPQDAVANYRKNQELKTPPSAWRRAGDVAVDVARSAIGLGQSVVGLAELADPTALIAKQGPSLKQVVTGEQPKQSQGIVADALKAVGYDPATAHAMLQDLYSPQRKAAEQEVSQAEGFLGKAGALVSNPSVLVGELVQSAPQFLAIQGVTRQLASRVFAKAEQAVLAAGGTAAQATAEATKAVQAMTGRLATTAAGAEGALSAGSVADEIIQANPDNPYARYWALPAGAGTAAIGKIASRFGGNIETMGVANKFGVSTSPIGSLANRTLRGVAGEGGEEMLQSGQEQLFTNVGKDRPVFENVPEAMGQGLVLGGAQGGALSAVGGKNAPAVAPTATLTQPDTAGISPPASSQTIATATPANLFSPGYIEQSTGVGEALARSLQQFFDANPSLEEPQRQIENDDNLSLNIIKSLNAAEEFFASDGINRMRNVDGYGGDAVGTVLDAYARIKNKHIDKRVRDNISQQLVDFLQNFENRPNFIFSTGQTKTQEASPSTDLAVTSPSLPVPFRAPDTSINGEFQDITNQAAIGQDTSRPVAELASPEVLQQKRNAEAEYEQAFNDLLKAEDLKASDAIFVQKRFALEQAEARLSEINAMLDGERAASIQAKRRALMDDVLANEAVSNIARRFKKELSSAGLDPVLSEAERVRIDRFSAAKAAFSENRQDDPLRQQELTNGIEGFVKERKPKPNTIPAIDRLPGGEAFIRGDVGQIRKILRSKGLELNGIPMGGEGLVFSRKDARKVIKSLQEVGYGRSIVSAPATSNTTSGNAREMQFGRSNADSVSFEVQPPASINTRGASSTAGDLVQGGGSNLFTGSAKSGEDASPKTNQALRKVTAKISGKDYQMDVAGDFYHPIAESVGASLVVASRDQGPFRVVDEQSGVVVGSGMTVEAAQKKAAATLQAWGDDTTAEKLGKQRYSQATNNPESARAAALAILGMSPDEIKATTQNSNMSKERLRVELAKAFGGKVISRLESSGVLVLHQDSSTIKKSRSGEVAGFFDGKNLHLSAAGMSPGDVKGVLLHEGWHKFLASLRVNETPQYQKLMSRLSDLENDPEAGEWFAVARSQIPENDKSDPEKRLDELAAYAIHDYITNGPQSLPGKLLRWVQDFLAFIRVSLARLSGGLPKTIGAPELAQISKRYLDSLAASPVKNKSDAIGSYPAAERASTMERYAMPTAKQALTVAAKEATASAVKARPYLLGALTRDQIADIWGGKIPEVREFDKLIVQMDARKNSILENADKLVEHWRQLDQKDADTLADLMVVATKAEYDPDPSTPQGKTPPANKEQLKAKAEWNKLSVDAKQIYKDVREAYKNQLLEVRDALSERAIRAGGKGANAASMADQIRLAFDGFLQKGPYFPLPRFGDFVLIADINGNKDTRTVEYFESVRKREDRANELKQQGYTVKLTSRAEYAKNLDGDSSAFAGKVINLIAGSGLPAQTQTDLIDSINQMAIEALPSASYRKHFLHRKGTPGFSHDQMRAFANQMLHSANHLARIEFADQVGDQLKSIEERIRSAPDGDVTEEQQVLNELRKRIEFIMSPQTHPIAGALGGLGFAMSLGGSIASGVTNLSQTALVTLPHLSAVYGAAKAIKAIGDASKAYFGGKWNKWSGYVLADNPNLSQDERDALNALEEEGIINLSQTHDLINAGTQSSTNSKKALAWNRAMKIVGWTFHVPEVFNRQVTALASFRLEMEKSGNKDAAIEAARDAIRRTHFDYSASNRARYMQGNFARVVTMFKQYSQQMTYMLYRNAYNALKGETPEVRRYARRMLAGVLTMHFAAAGAMGLPLGVFGITPMLAAMSLMLGSADDPWDWEVEFRNMLADSVGKEMGEAIAKGPARLLLPIDIAGRVGLGDLWVRAPHADKEGRGEVEAWMLTLLGPVAGYFGQWGTAYKEFGDGHVMRGAESLLPKAVSAPLRAYRYATEGVRSVKGDDLGIDLDAGEIFGQALGFTPSKLSEMYEGRNAIKERERKLSRRRQEILTMFVMAKQEGDAEMQQRAFVYGRDFSRENPAMSLDAQSFSKAWTTHEKNAKQIKAGVFLNKKQESLRDFGRFANVEDDDEEEG